MNAPEYARVFGTEPYSIDPSEVIVDIGSGDSNLSGLTPTGRLIQIDPIYINYPQGKTSASNDRLLRVPLQIGENDERTRDGLRIIGELNPARVTMANTLRYVPADNKVRAIEQMLLLGRHGLTQLYPFRQKNADAVVEGAERLGFVASFQQIGWGGARQTVYALTRINTTLTVELQPERAGPSDRRKIAELIVSQVI